MPGPSRITLETLFVHVKIPWDLPPKQKQQQYESPLGHALEEEQVGSVIPGGMLLTWDDLENLGSPHSGIDVELTDPHRGMPLLRRTLISLKAPKETTLCYNIDQWQYELPLYAS